MRYMLMLYADEKAGAQMPKAQMGKAMEQMFAYQGALEKAGAFIMTSPLHPTSEARTLRVEGGTPRFDGNSFVNDGGELKVHDGPYAETREQFGGFYLIEARNMDEALDWAGKCPAVQWGSVEVRELVPGY